MVFKPKRSAAFASGDWGCFSGSAFAVYAFPCSFPSTYTEEEITDSLCIRLLHEREEFDNPVRFLGKEKTDEYIIIGFIHPSHPYYPAEASILLFIEDEDKKGEYHYSDCRNLLKELPAFITAFLKSTAITVLSSIQIPNSARW